jgi:putative oxidoreductase
MSGISALARKVYGLFERAAGLLQPLVLLAARLYWGWQLFESGKGKLGNISMVVDYFGSLGMPAPEVTARLISGLELVGGILLFLGLASRPIALILTGNMIGAYWMGDREAFLSVLSDPDKFQAAAPFTFLCVSVVVLAFGPGSLSLDALIARIFKKSDEKS